MLRRKLFAYLIMMITGITCAYLFMEKEKIISAVLIMIVVALSVRTVDLEYVPERTLRERQILIAFILIGYLCFTFSYARMNQRPVLIKENGYEEMCLDDISTVTKIDGVVYKISCKGDSYRIEMLPKNLKHCGRIEALYYKELPSEKDNELLGSEVTLYGTLKIPQGQDNPCCFNYRTYLYSKGVRFTFSTKYMKLKKYSKGIYWNYRKNIAQIRDDFLSMFQGDTEAFIRGVVFGDKSQMDDDMLDEFNTNSTGHILAVSGLHVGFLFSLLRILTRKKRTKPVTVLIIAIVFIYGEMTGWSPSTLRAVLVLSINISAIYWGRSPDLLTSVSASAILILTADPYQLINAGFQLSYSALLGLCFLADPLSYYIGETLSSIVAVQLAIAPLIIFYYSTFNAMSLFINIPIVFMASILVPLCIVSLGIMSIAGTIPDIGIIMIRNLSEIIIRINRFLSFDSFFSNQMEGINAGVLIAYYVIVFFAGSEWLRIKLIRKQYNTVLNVMTRMLIPLIILISATYNCYIDDNVVFISVGQGDSIHVRGNCCNVLLDGGGSTEYNVAKNILKPYLLNNGVDRVDAAAVTHLHTDHFQGIIDLNRLFPLGTVAIPEMCRKSLTDENMAEFDDIKLLSAGDIIRVDDDIYIEAIWPAGKYVKESDSFDENENNNVYMIHSGGSKILVTGDLLESDELDMLEYYRNTDVLKCDVLKVGHHGSKTSSSEQFLDACAPDIAVISVGSNNPYGHPHEQTLERLRQKNITVYRTDLNGAVGLEIKDGIVKVDTMN